MRSTDEELAALLREALNPGNPSPPPGSVQELRSLAASAIPRRSPARFGSRAAAATALFLGMSGSAAGVAVASGATLPEPLRVVAHGIGLPVDSVGLAETRTDADRLRRDLSRGDLQLIPRDASTLQSSFSGLSGGDRSSIGGQVDSLLDRAGAYDGHGDGGTAAAPTTSGTPATSGSDGDGDREGGGTSTTPTTVAGTQSTSSGDGGISGGSSGGGGSDGGSTTTTTTTTAPPSTSGGGTDGGGSGGGTDGGSVSGSDGGG